MNDEELAAIRRRLPDVPRAEMSSAERDRADLLDELSVAWERGRASGISRAMRFMSDEPGLDPRDSTNPYPLVATVPPPPKMVNVSRNVARYVATALEASGDKGDQHAAHQIRVALDE